MKDIVQLTDLSKEEIPVDLKAETYFDFAAHPFAHKALFEKSPSVCHVLSEIHEYALSWIHARIDARRPAKTGFETGVPPPCHCIGAFEVFVEQGAVFEPAHIIGGAPNETPHRIYVESGARIVGATLYPNTGSIYFSEEATVEPGAGIKGPAVIGQRTEIRQGAFLRGDILIGANVTVRGEIKNSVIMDESDFPHPSYLGDSLCGFGTHFGNQVTTANFGIFAGLLSRDRRKTLAVCCEDRWIDLGRTKMGVCMGDFCQIGCNSVTDPATFLKPWTIVYPLARVPKGFHGPREVLKYKPLEHGVIERSPLQSPEKTASSDE